PSPLSSFCNLQFAICNLQSVVEGLLMARGGGGYFGATRHPWACLVFLLPLLIAYEGGVFWLGEKHPEALRTGADTWLRWGLEAFGLNQLYWLPALLGVAFLALSWLRRDSQPRDMIGVCGGMAIESVLFAVALWGISRSLGP